MDEDSYIKNRLDNQINWYSSKSQSNKKWFKSLRTLEILLAALIPLLSGIGENIPYYQILIGCIGVAITIIAGLITLNKYQENWLNYRTTAETLKHEKFLFQTKTEPYDASNSFSLLVQRTESLISTENSQWLKCLKKKT